MGRILFIIVVCIISFIAGMNAVVWARPKETDAQKWERIEKNRVIRRAIEACFEQCLSQCKRVIK